MWSSQNKRTTKIKMKAYPKTYTDTCNECPSIPSGCTLHVKTFDQFTCDELYELLRIRSEVFIVEQNCVYQDLDNHDQTAIHLWLTHGDKVVALCRVCPAGTQMRSVSIGRVITTERGKGYGLSIVKSAIAIARERLEEVGHIDIEAQLTKKAFYEKLGFVATSEPFMMEGLYHLDMKLTF